MCVVLVYIDVMHFSISDQNADSRYAIYIFDKLHPGSHSTNFSVILGRWLLERPLDRSMLYWTRVHRMCIHRH